MSRRLRWTLKLLLLLAVASALSLWSWGRFAARSQGAPSVALAAQPADTVLDRVITPLLTQHPAQSAASLVTDNVQAFSLRAVAAREAGRSLDAMYYIWRGDLTGNLLKYELLGAAERGVRVRLLIDDMNGPTRDPLLLAMNTHPNLEVRLFNPARNRETAWRRALEMVLRFVGFNRRMHNKAWIADGQVALVGGRNIGDEYFNAAERMNFHDADLLLLGPAVAQTSEVFDRFWNSAAVVPLAALRQEDPAPEKLPLWREELRAGALASSWVQALGDPRTLAERLRTDMRLHWTPHVRVVSDPPEKAAPLSSQRERAEWLLYDLMALLFSAQQQTLLISPYFVPGDAGALLLNGQAARGMDVQVLTNSLAATDVSIVHAGYKRHRTPLLAGGVRLFELKPGAAVTGKELLGSSGASLHTKAFVVDGERGFVGSFNFDPRSAQLNTEMGVLFDHAPLAQELQALFTQAAAPDSAWALDLTPEGELQWLGDSGRQRHDPETSWGLRAMVWLMGWLPIESQL